jgi:hypothetical protein
MNDHADLSAGNEPTDARNDSDAETGIWDESGLLVGSTAPPQEVPRGYSTSPESLKSTKDTYKP